MNRPSRWILHAAARVAGLLPPFMRQWLYRLGPVTRGLRRLLNQAAPAGLTEIEVAAGALAGLTLRLNLQEEKDYWLGSYEPQLQAALKDYAGPGMTVYDIGANIGYISILLGRLVGETGRVFAFEALGENVARLEENVRLNQFADRTTVIHAAVIAHSGPADFLVHASRGMGKVSGSAGRDSHYQTRITVPGISIDAFVFEGGNPAPDLIKMDIEGGEVLALPGMRRTLETIRPVLLMELHGEDAAMTTWNLLAETGYRLHRMRPNYPEIERLEDLDWKSYVVALAQQPQ